MISKELKELVKIVNGSTPSSKNKEFYGGNISWITPKDLSNINSRYISQGERSISKLGYASCSTTLVPPGTVLLSSRAPIGLLAISESELCTNQGFKSLVPCNSSINSEFLYYYLKTKLEDLNNLGSGTTFKELSKKSISAFKIFLPENSYDQKRIVKVLSNIDSKIELNNKINAELEAMAKLLYDYWFVQFDFPDENGKPYKSSGGKMVYSDELKREIPVGWAVDKLGKKTRIVLGGTPSTKKEHYWNGSINWLKSGEIAKFPIIESELKITKKAVQESATSLMSKNTITVSITRHIRTSILAIDACANQSVVGILENKMLKKSYLYQLILNEIPRYMKLRTGAQQPHINKEIIEETQILIPNKEELKKYYKVMKPFYEKINQNSFQSHKLLRLRDLLLPMLMNGQVRVKGKRSSNGS